MIQQCLASVNTGETNDMFGMFSMIEILRVGSPK